MAPRATTRQIYDLISHETYHLCRVDDLEWHAPILAGWTGVRNVGGRFNRRIAILDDDLDPENNDDLGNDDHPGNDNERGNENDTIESESEGEGAEESTTASAGRTAKRAATVVPDNESQVSDAISDSRASVRTSTEDQEPEVNDQEPEANEDHDSEYSYGEPYCHCGRVSKGIMIACDSYSCPNGWFHLGCVGIEEVPTGEWYCPNCRDETMGHMGMQRQD